MHLAIFLSSTHPLTLESFIYGFAFVLKAPERDIYAVFLLSPALSRVSGIEVSSTSICIMKERTNVLEKVPIDI